VIADVISGNPIPMRRRAIPCGVILALAAAVSAAALEPAADVGFVAKGDPLPNAVVNNGSDVNRLKPLLEALPEAHRLRLEFTTVPKSLTGYPDDLRYARIVTTVDADDRPDGLEIEHLDWYRPPLRRTTFKAGVKDGVERLFHPATETVQQEIPWVDGRIDGVKKAYHPNGKLASETPYTGGTISGEVRSFTPQGAVLRVARFDAGVRDGEMIDYWPDSDGVVERSVPYLKGKIHGTARAFYANGTPKWERPFRDNLQHGLEKQFAADGSVEKERHWIDGDPVSAEEFAAKFKP
jgi:hypothetical protein